VERQAAVLIGATQTRFALVSWINTKTEKLARQNYSI